MEKLRARPKLCGMSVYMSIASNVSRQVASGALREGDRVPSLRQLSRQMHVSITTAQQAYLWLESRGFLESRPRSGFFVRAPFSRAIEVPRFESRKAVPAQIDTDSVLSDVVTRANDPANVPFGVSSASPELFPTRKLNLILRKIVRERPDHSARYDFGGEQLRRQIARRSLSMGCDFAPEDLTITSGALEAIHLALRAVANPGDVIAVESPSHFLILGCAAALNLRVIEISTHPQEGIDLNELEAAIRKHKVKACVLIPNCHNPLGYVLSDRKKKAIVDLATRHDVALIEDDVYGDLAHSGVRPRLLKSFDRKDLVLSCSSFSKVLSPGYRIGWLVAGRFREKLARIKLLTTVATPSLSQSVIAEFLESGGYDRHLRRMQAEFARLAERMRHATASYFPEGTRITLPAGGHMLWVELPPDADAMKLYTIALEKKISILPGPIFSATGRYRNHIRLNCATGWSPAHERALITLGQLSSRLLRLA